MVLTSRSELRLLLVNNETPITFCVKRDVPQRHTLIEKIKEHGGEITENYCDADFVLGDPTKTQIPMQGVDKVTSYKFVLDSIAAKRLRPPSSYELVISGSRSGRCNFTVQDDRDLESYLNSISEGLKGNEIYKKFEKIAWRSRAVRKFVGNSNVTRNAQTISKVRSANNSPALQDADSDDLATEEILESAIRKNQENEITDANDDDLAELTSPLTQNSRINNLTSLDDEYDVSESFETISGDSFTGKSGSEINPINYLTDENSPRPTREFDDRSIKLGKRRRIDEDVQEQPASKRSRYSAVDEEFLLKVKELSEEFHVPKTEVIRILGDTSCNFAAVRDYLSNNDILGDRATVINEKYFWDNEEDAILFASTDRIQFEDILRKHGVEQTKERIIFLNSFFNR
ncbi:21302_t:CDS:2 [Cetraspora pellucida]|uniref:DNA-binding protein RAP1 n=1 Tax=Cetraspora pellucida TaxID=1433469 RepID=A0A9N9EM85_9GLOM|nr:21302_t:CDS:2 [Cetraspora pellucida]